MTAPDIQALFRRAEDDDDPTAIDELITINLDRAQPPETRLAAYEALERCYYALGELGDYAEQQAALRGARRP